MKVALTTYMSAENGITLKVLPETDVELALLKGFGSHGEVSCEDGELRIRYVFKQVERGKGK